MKSLHPYIAILFINVCLIASCNNAPNDIPVIDIDNPIGYIDLQLSDLLDDITMVPLETRDDILLSTAKASFIVTNNYILVKTEEQLLQFDHKGKFIRILAMQGNGPNEFNSLGNSLVDEENEIFYYTNLGRNSSIARINLKTGAFLESLYPDIPPFSINAIDSKGYIYGFPLVVDSILLAYRYNPADKGIITYKRSHPFATGNRGQEMFAQGDHVFFLSFPYSDTLFKISESESIPQYVITLKNLITDNSRGGVSLKFPYSGTQGAIIEQWESRILMGEYGRSIDSRLLSYTFLNKKAELQAIRSVTIDPIALIIDIDDYLKQKYERSAIGPMPITSGLWGHIAVEASDMIEFIDQALKGDRLSADQRKALEEVSAKIDEESNPVLIIGKVK